MIRPRFIILGFLISLFTPHFADSKVICEGFVKVPANIPLDLSKIQVTLLTKEGNLKYESSCNPQNGYFMVPVYNKGRFKLKVNAPEGWLFEPEVQEIVIDDENNATKCSEEIIFSLSGFTISGSVLSGGTATKGPENFKLTLFDEGGKSVSTALTDAAGNYKFTVEPGNYMVSTDQDSSQCIDRGKVSVEAINAPVLVKPDIAISGYNLKVVVKNTNGSPLPEANVVLASNINVHFENSPINSEKPKSHQDGSKWLYVLKTDKTGVAQFYCLPPEKYSVRATFSNDFLDVNFEPEEQFVKISVKADEAVLKASSFNIRGKVASGSTPVEGAGIAVNGVKKAVTDVKGNFQLVKLEEGTYSLTASKKHFEFAELKKELSFGYMSPLNFAIERLAVCGVVEFDSIDSKSSNEKDSTVQLLVKLQGHQDVFKTIKVTRKDNQFCQMLPPGNYLIMPSQTSLSFAPKSKQVNLRISPQLDVRFTQFKAIISGKVNCFENCKNVMVRILSEGKVVQEVFTSSVFKFSDVPAGKYLVKINDDYSIWWKQNEQDVQVVDKDVEDVTFQQSGYVQEIKTSHAAEMIYSEVSKGKNSAAKTVNLVEGLNKIYFESSGTYSYTLHSCHQLFSPSKSNQLTVPSGERLILDAVKTQQSVSILTNEPSTEEKFKILISDTTVNQPKEVVVEETSVTSRNNHSFVFNVDTNAVGHKFLIAPQSQKYLFRPLVVEYKFDGECASNIAVFKAEVGKFIQGVVKPAVSGVQVTATAKNNLPALSGQTDSSGHYSVGPVWNVEDYVISVQKDGYDFIKEKTNPLIFKSTKLSHLKISFLDSETKKPLPEVLVSLSGSVDYRSNSIVDHTGVINYIGLPAGEYYLQSVLQEYKFDATSTKVVVKEGETLELTLFANKFAYSAFGVVTTINKKPIGQVVHVEAVSQQCNNHQEEDSSNPKNSEFRIRGLRPDCLYKVTLKDENSQKINSYPPSIDVITQNQDIHGINFIVIPEQKVQNTVFGKITFEGLGPPAASYRIVLSAASGESTIHEVLVKSPVTVFMFSNISLNQGSLYTVGFDHLEAKKFKIDQSTATTSFVAEPNFQYIKLVVKQERKMAEVEVSSANYFGFALLLLITLAFLNQSKTKIIVDRVRTFCQRIINYKATNSINQDNGQGEGGDRRRKTKKT
uniref:Nodal modulator 1 n=1 Tax=Ditylenchus dipsaci TaxID=166011 RepID=A0A915DMW4_9BILA